MKAQLTFEIDPSDYEHFEGYVGEGYISKSTFEPNFRKTIIFVLPSKVVTIGIIGDVVNELKVKNVRLEKVIDDSDYQERVNDRVKATLENRNSEEK